jgi:hypothetical protein
MTSMFFTARIAFAVSGVAAGRVGDTLVAPSVEKEIGGSRRLSRW